MASMSDRDGHIWYDGKLVPWRDATTHVLTHTLHYGMGVFEGVRAYKTSNGTAIFRLHEHTDRLFRSAHINGMAHEFGLKTVAEFVEDEMTAKMLAEMEEGAVAGSRGWTRAKAEGRKPSHAKAKSVRGEPRRLPAR